MKKLSIVMVIVCATFYITACYKDSVEELSNSGDCNTTNMSYSKDIRPIINISCALSGCHNPGTVLTFPLASYDNVKAEVDGGLFLKSINHESGAEPMPKSASKLSACNINKITSWINSGAPNN